MAVIKNFKKYIPESPEKLELMENFNIEFCKSEDGQDWYDCRDLFNQDLLKVIFDTDTGEIIMASKDVMSLCSPINASVADVDYDVNVTIDDLQGKIFNLRTQKIVDKVYTKEEIKKKVEVKIEKLTTEAFNLMRPLEYAEKLNMISEEEAEYLLALQKYTVMLNRIPQQKGFPSTIDWPTLPIK